MCLRLRRVAVWQAAAGVLSLSSHQLGSVPLNRITLTYPDWHYTVVTTKTFIAVGKKPNGALEVE